MISRKGKSRKRGGKAGGSCCGPEVGSGVGSGRVGSCLARQSLPDVEPLEEELEGDAGEDDRDDHDDQSGREEEPKHVGARVADRECERHRAAQAGQHQHHLVLPRDLVRPADVQKSTQREDVRRASDQNGHLTIESLGNWYVHTFTH